MNDAAFLEELHARAADEEVVAVARELIRWVPLRIGKLQWGEGPRGRGRALAKHGRRWVALFSFRVTGDISFDFAQVIGNTPFGKDEGLLRQLEERMSRLPGRPLSAGEVRSWVDVYRMKFLTDPDALTQFKEIWEWVAAQLKDAASAT